MIATARQGGWGPALLVLPLMGLVFMSYRMSWYRRRYPTYRANGDRLRMILMNQPRCAAFLTVLVSVVPLPAQNARSPFARAVDLLNGDWVGEGGGSPGQGAGGFSFRSELDGKALMRRNRADYPATAGKPAFHHEDFMVIYQEAGTEPVRAFYFDTEGHAILYMVEVAEDGSAITFTGSGSNGGPAYRLSYRKTAADALAGRFETAPPGKPGAFATYLEWTAHRK